MIISSQPQGATPLDELRWWLDQAENRVGALETGSAGDTLKLLRMLDEIERIYNNLAAADVDLRAEDSRRETIRLIVQRKCGVVLRSLRPEGGYAAVRARQQPSSQDSWWQLDAYAAQRRQQSLRSFTITAAIVIGVLAVATILYNTVFRPDPAVIARMNHMQNAQLAIEQNKLDAALQAMDAGLAEFPDDGELQLWRGVILARLDRPQEAEAAFDAARPTFADEPTFLVNRSTIRLQAGDVDRAYADAREATTLDPDSAYAFLVLGGAQELRGEINAASSSYSKAAGLAAAQKNTQLEAMAKVRMAMLLQSAPMILNPATPQATPTRP